MRTNIVIADSLIKEGIKYTGIKTKRELGDCALRELIARSRRKEILTLKGKLPWEGEIEAMRTRRCHDSD